MLASCIRCAFLLYVLIGLPGLGWAQWHPVAGPVNAQITSLGELNNGRLISISYQPFLAQYSRYLSDDGGDHWTLITQQNTLESSTFLHIGDTALAINQYRNGKSYDNGLTWSLYSLAANPGFYKAALCGRRIIGLNRQMKYSDDLGASWANAAMPADLPVGNARDILVKGDTVFVSGTGIGILVSTDRGASYRLMHTGLDSWDVHGLALCNGQVYALSKPTTASTYKVFKAVHTLWWREMSVNPSISLTHFTSDGQHLFVYDELNPSPGILRSDDEGVHWRRVYSDSIDLPSNPIQYEQNVSGLFASSHGLFAHVSLNGLLKTRNGGDTWTDQNYKLSQTWVYDFQAIGSHTFAATDYGVFRRDEPSGTWKRVGYINQYYFKASSLAALGDTLFALDNRGDCYRSVDLGMTWAMDSPIPGTYPGNLQAYNGRLYVRASSQTWVRSTGGSTPQWSSAWAEELTSFVSLGSTGLAATSDAPYFKRTMDGGRTWTDFYATQFDADLSRLALHRGRLYGGHIYTGVDYSTDQGTTWNRAFPGTTMNWVVEMISTQDSLYVATAHDVYISGDGGATYSHEAITNEAGNILSMEMIDGQLHLGTTHGIWARGPEGERIIVNTEKPKKEATLSIYPNPGDGRFTVQLPEGSAEVVLTVYDAKGALVRQEKLSAGGSHALTLERRPGLYLLVVQADGTRYQQCLVVE